MTTGRPTKCTPETTAKVCKALRVGASIKLACKFARISESMFHRWYGDADRLCANQAEYQVFRESVDEAVSDCFLTLHSTVMKTARNDADMALKVLERRLPEDWGRTHKLEHSGPQGGPMEHRTEDASNELLRRLQNGAKSAAEGGSEG